jgi:hypothetical protein
MKNAGEPVSDIVAFLELQKRPVDRFLVGWWNAEGGARIARQLLSSYRSRGEAGLFKAAATYRQSPPLKLFR